ncbi:NAD(P)H-dependent oxidoreductase [Streptomyces mobaraensis NBRC 13819 = DSM 40847]|uniref:Flavoprotein n=1 Tax=Streptomyces mobaraensis (strain ATCC 29032 / DSM 40847 / JCM 4168 / NBRC 13819 / NCIMB 11159 / IPCR 16-22) TaxID=1223523 RepID=M3AXZ6_STRM1|nr:NAD(P)H-dependent oxidoreductase [Streptomyces mobaraensis]EME98482.1 flavoprotein [Streptomyces mobaraensis NBRC 13819 = DSM 40847]QTT75103.1 NAD(P)H-dependent oxidoreductase [Streptomyces mobaraensis NBRC 13819 = DSM 40847]
MSHAPYRLAVIVASTRDGRFGPTVADWLGTHLAERDDIDADVVDLAELPLPARLSPQPDADDAALLGAVSPRLERADAFVIITPEYNHSYPASLKTLIDWHATPWRAKPVAFVSYGGLSGGLRAVEHLRPVLAELHAVTIRETVSFHSPWGAFDASGRHLDEEAGNRAAGAAKVLLDQLTWWAVSLREAREARPYTV